jgi:3-phenylpropionate/trans-cinnamate dioxygenase ferredoxin reductase subunit
MVIVGAGECGARAALGLRDQGFAGPVTLIGEEIHLPYERPPLSKAAMTGLDHPEPKWVATAQRLAELGITVRGATRVMAIDRPAKRLVLSAGETLPYEKLLLATGAAPRRLARDNWNTSGIQYLRTYDDALALRARCVPGARVLIIGGGFIGLELAASARLRGASVTVLEAQPRLLMRGVPAEIAEILAIRHRLEGVAILTDTGIAEIQQSGPETAVMLDDGTTLLADLAIAGIGAAPRTELAAAAGLSLDNGIAVDATLVTSDPEILAAGDCCSFPLPLYGHRRIRLESWRNAQEQGTLAARNMLGQNLAVSAVPWFWSDQYDLGLQTAGLAEGATTHIRRAISADAFILFHLHADGRLLAASGIGPGTAVARDIRLAEMLIANSAHPDPRALAEPGFKLKSLLAA